MSTGRDFLLSEGFQLLYRKHLQNDFIDRDKQFTHVKWYERRRQGPLVLSFCKVSLEVAAGSL